MNAINTGYTLMVIMLLLTIAALLKYFDLLPPRPRRVSLHLRTLLATSGNDYSTFLTARLGLPTTVAFFQQVFGQSINQPTGEVCIGLHPEMAVSPLQLATAYTMFARGGSITEPKPFTSVYLDERPLELAETQTRAVLPADATYVTTQMMRPVTGAGLDGAFGTLRAAFQTSGLPLEQMDIAAKSGSGPEAV